MNGLVGMRLVESWFSMFDYDTWLSTPPELLINVWEIDEDENGAYDAYDEWKDNVAMGYEY